MSILPILCYPDPRLHTVAKPVAKVDDRIRQLVQDMYATMYDAQGVGLAATPGERARARGRGRMSPKAVTSPLR